MICNKTMRKNSLLLLEVLHVSLETQLWVPVIFNQDIWPRRKEDLPSDKGLAAPVWGIGYGPVQNAVWRSFIKLIGWFGDGSIDWSGLETEAACSAEHIISGQIASTQLPQTGESLPAVQDTPVVYKNHLSMMKMDKVLEISTCANV